MQKIEESTDERSTLHKIVIIITNVTNKYYNCVITY